MFRQRRSVGEIEASTAALPLQGALLPLVSYAISIVIGRQRECNPLTAVWDAVCCCCTGCTACTNLICCVGSGGALLETWDDILSSCENPEGFTFDECLMADNFSFSLPHGRSTPDLTGSLQRCFQDQRRCTKGLSWIMVA